MYIISVIWCYRKIVAKFIIWHAFRIKKIKRNNEVYCRIYMYVFVVIIYYFIMLVKVFFGKSCKEKPEAIVCI